MEGGKKGQREREREEGKQKFETEERESPVCNFYC